MSIREVTRYIVECDADGCTLSTPDLSGGDYHSWPTQEDASACWEQCEQHITRLPDGTEQHLCAAHARACGECGALGSEDEHRGEYWCSAHVLNAQMGLPL